MSKGTKQIRSGRVESIIRVIEERVGVYEGMRVNTFKDDTMARLLIENRQDELRHCLNMLREAIK